MMRGGRGMWLFGNLLKVQKSESLVVLYNGLGMKLVKSMCRVLLIEVVGIIGIGLTVL